MGRCQGRRTGLEPDTGQDRHDHHGVGDGRDQPHPGLTAGTLQNILKEHALHQLRPRQPALATSRSRCPSLSAWEASSAWSPSMARCETRMAALIRSGRHPVRWGRLGPSPVRDHEGQWGLLRFLRPLEPPPSPQMGFGSKKSPVRIRPPRPDRGSRDAASPVDRMAIRGAPSPDWRGAIWRRLYPTFSR